MKTDEIKTFFSDVLGPDAVMQSPDSKRPYIKVATKGEAVLYANFDLGPSCGHRKAPNGKLMHIPAVGVYARFFQKGGEIETFQPQFTCRAPGEGIFRLDKHQFPVCPLFGGAVKESWEKQAITAQLVDWLKGLILAASGVPVSDEIMREVINLALRALPPTDAFEFFSLDAMDHNDVKEAQEEDEAGEGKEDTAAETIDPMAKLLEAMQKAQGKKNGNGGGMVN